MAYDKCEFCGAESRAKSATSMINRHIRDMATKTTPEERGNHPAVGSREYQRVKGYRNFVPPAKDEEERHTRKLNSGAKYREDRRVLDMRKVKAAYSLLKYFPPHNQHRPRPISLNPTFAELVVYHLPKDEQKRRFSDPSDPPGSKVSVLDKYHYQQLQECVGVDLHELKAAWKAWKQLGQYEHGELFRQTLYNTTKGLTPHIQLYQEIKIGMWDGTIKEKGIFEDRWERKGMREAKSDKDWVMWKDVIVMTKYRPEIIGCLREDCNHGNDHECLGARIYR